MSTEPKRPHMVLRAVVAPALGLTVAALGAAACKHSETPAGGTIEQGQSREMIAPGMVAYVPPDTGAGPEDAASAAASSEDAASASTDTAVVEQPAPRRDTPALRPPPGPPPRREDRVGMSNSVRPRPGPPPGARVEQTGFKSAEDKSPPAPQRVARRARGVDEGPGSLPGIAGARRRP